MCASILMLVALTWERHFAICSPHQYRIHIRTTPRWRHLCRYFIPVMLCSILFNIPTFINIEVCPALALLHFLHTILKKSKISKKVLRRYLRSKITLFLVNQVIRICIKLGHNFIYRYIQSLNKILSLLTRTEKTVDF